MNRSKRNRPKRRQCHNKKKPRSTKKILIDRCDNPFELEKHIRFKRLRNISQPLREKFPKWRIDSKICAYCRKRAHEEPSQSIPESVRLNDDDRPNFLSNSTTDSPESEAYQFNDNDSLHSPATKKLKLEPVGGEPLDKNEYDAAMEILQQLKDKFASSTAESQKLLILTLAPKSWSVEKLATEFNTTKHRSSKAKHLVREYGILTAPDSKLGKRLIDSTVGLIRKFYENDENSRIMPGKKDFVSVKGGYSNRHYFQKRLILRNLKELYQCLK